MDSVGGSMKNSQTESVDDKKYIVLIIYDITDNKTRNKMVACLEKYGVDHVWKSKEIHKKCIETIEKRYGVTSTFALESSKQNMLSKYGVTNIM